MKSKEKEDNADQGDSKKKSSDNDAKDGATGKDRNAEPKRFERPDNLRRRSEWFQKRTGRR